MTFMLIFASALMVYIAVRLHKAYFYRLNFIITVPLLFLAAFSFIILRLLSSRLGFNIPNIVFDISYAVLGIYVYFILFFLICDILRILPFFRQYYNKYTKRINGLILILSFSLFGYGFYHQTQTVIETYNIEFAKPLQKPLKIAAIADIHIGSGMSVSRLTRHVEEINALNPDIIMLVGDIIDSDVKDFTPAFRQALRGLQAPLGSYVVFGNHEHYSGYTGEISKLFQDAGLTLLFDEAKYFEDFGFYLLGRDSLRHSAGGDERTKVENLTYLIKDKTKPLIIMDHIPRSTNDGKTLDAMLQISGHTHDGQFAPITFIVKAIYPISHGILKEDDFHLLVTSGLGLWGPPMRVGTQSEIVEINVK